MKKFNLLEYAQYFNTFKGQKIYVFDPIYDLNFILYHKLCLEKTTFVYKEILEKFVIEIFIDGNKFQGSLNNYSELIRYKKNKSKIIEFYKMNELKEYENWIKNQFAGKNCSFTAGMLSIKEIHNKFYDTNVYINVLERNAKQFSYRKAKFRCNIADIINKTYLNDETFILQKFNDFCNTTIKEEGKLIDNKVYDGIIKIYSANIGEII